QRVDGAAQEDGRLAEHVKRLAQRVAHVDGARDGAREVADHEHQEDGDHHPREAHLTVVVVPVVFVAIVVAVDVIIPEARGARGDVDATVEVDDEPARDGRPHDQQENLERLARVVKVKVTAGQHGDEAEMTPHLTWIESEGDGNEPGGRQHHRHLSPSEDHVIHLAVHDQFVAVPRDGCDGDDCCACVKTESVAQDTHSPADVDVEGPAPGQVGVHVDGQHQRDEQQVTQAQVRHEQVGRCLKLLGLRHGQYDEDVTW
ncbi:hypothetical protein EGW08_022426, partial [Elysia chlorotica]